MELILLQGLSVGVSGSIFGNACQANFATDKEVSFDPDRDEGIYIGYRQL